MIIAEDVELGHHSPSHSPRQTDRQTEIGYTFQLKAGDYAFHPANLETPTMTGFESSVRQHAEDSCISGSGKFCSNKAAGASFL